MIRTWKQKWKEHDKKEKNGPKCMCLFTKRPINIFITSIVMTSGLIPNPVHCRISVGPGLGVTSLFFPKIFLDMLVSTRMWAATLWSIPLSTFNLSWLMHTIVGPLFSFVGNPILLSWRKGPEMWGFLLNLQKWFFAFTCEFWSYHQSMRHD